ncbi:TPA: hypothetical protein RMI67_006447 [Bacillus cereus]|nr:hypothetical protein [Bacillus cereus]
MEKLFATHVSLVNGKTHSLHMKLENFVEKVIALDGSFRVGLIRFDDIVINPEYIVSIQQVTSVRARRPSRTI